MSTVDMKGLKALQTAAANAYIAWNELSAYAFQNHAGYSPALKASKSAVAAFEAVRVKANDIIGQLAGDPETDPSWFDPSDPKGPVWLFHNAQSAIESLLQGRQALFADLAAHFQISPSEVAVNPEAATRDADEGAQAPHHDPTVILNPNALSPGAQSSSSPPVDAPPPHPDEGWPWYVWPAVAAVGWALWRVVVRG